MVFVFIYIYWCPTRFFHIRWCTSRLTVIRRVSLADYILYCNLWPLYCLSFFWFLLGYLQTVRAYKTNLTPPDFNKVSAQREESQFFLRFFYWILELFRQCGIFVYHIFNIISHFNLLFFHTFQILSLFNFLFFHIFHIFAQFSSIFSLSFHYSTYVSSICSISFFHCF
jgi:hypothetical protein